MATTPASQPSSFLIKIADGLIERFAKNYITTVIGILVGLAGSIAAFTPLIPPKYQAGAAAFAAFSGAVALGLSKDK